jgi:hypothetical protein
MDQCPESAESFNCAGQIIDGGANRHVHCMADDVESVGLQLGCALRQPYGVVVCDHQQSARPEPARARHAHPARSYGNDHVSHACPQAGPLGELMFKKLTSDQLTYPPFRYRSADEPPIHERAPMSSKNADVGTDQ